ncbi:MAG: hypothetical protein CK428_31435 [Mycobacterium sp.]|nr:MAG: hypothetical protein CK428_31435 [Mycobacterium sp.]
MTAALSTLSLVLGVVAVAQAIELYAQGWRMALGTFPDWMAGFGTIFTATAAVAAYRTFKVAAHEWEGAEKERKALESERQKADNERQALAATREAERQDHAMSQARLIIAQPKPPNIGELISGALVELPARQRDVQIHNHSNEPVFNLQVEEESACAEDVRVWQSLNPPAMPEHVPVLQGGQSTKGFVVVGNHGVTPNTELIEFAFTDARGARWRRLGSKQPVQILDPGPKHKTGTPGDSR